MNVLAAFRMALTRCDASDDRYLWLTGKVNMRAVEVTIQNLIGSGMDPKTENNPYLGFIYTSFQERATKARARASRLFDPSSHALVPSRLRMATRHVLPRSMGMTC